MSTIRVAAIARVQDVAAELATVQRRIEHLDWLLSPSRCMQPVGAAQLATERDTLRHQTVGNLLVDLRQAQAALELEMSR